MIVSVNINNFNEIDKLGIQSEESQGLRGPITSIQKLSESANQLLILYICSGLSADNSSHHTSHTSVPRGYIKYGFKNLYFYSAKGKVTGVKDCKCILDFYVNEGIQRQEIGLLLFKHMLQELNTEACLLAYDRPSQKLLAFLAKHFNLTTPNHQPNKYTVYEGFPIES